MYSGMLRRAPFQPDESSFQYAKEREAVIRRFQEREGKEGEGALVPLKEEPRSLGNLLDMISPEDSALISLIVFLLCDNSENDVVLLGILLYVLLSK